MKERINYGKKMLFLDDIRMPRDVMAYKYNSIYNIQNNDWVIVRNYNDFVSYIIKNGIPNVISFDHDLADIYHKTISHTIDIDYHNSMEKTGFHCAKWLIEYCIENKLKLPDDVYIHSMNIIGSENIKSLFNTYKKIYKNE